MSMASYEPDRDWGDENAYEEHRARFSSGMCDQCKNDVALPDDPDGFCQACALEAELRMADLEDVA